MRAYHLYTYDRERQLIGPPVLIHEESDARAIEHAQKIFGFYHHAELYESQRLVHKFPNER